MCVCVLTWCTLAFLSMRIHELMHWVTITFSCLAFDESALLLMSLPCFWWEELEPVCFRFVSRPFVMSLYCGFSCESSNDDNVSHASRQFRCAYVHVQFRTTMLTCVFMHTNDHAQMHMYSSVQSCPHVYKNASMCIYAWGQSHKLAVSDTHHHCVSGRCI
jgi:hypothetical protein